ncbi:MAG: hypothetical protein HOP28_01570 [Gemmatimonadales bacterium]|nr:hypothetical protein [Gemmatimonadales bacterium]
MRHRASYLAVGLALVALGCKGHPIDPDFPGTGNPVPGSPPALALRLGGTGADQIADIAVLSGGDVIVAGTFEGSVDFDPGTGVSALTSLGATDLYVARFTATGGLVWVVRLGGTGAETVATLAGGGAGNIVVGGTFEGAADFDPGPGTAPLASTGGRDAYVAALTPNGTLLWARRFGGSTDDDLADLAVDAAGNVYAAGAFAGSADATPAAGAAIVSDGAQADGFALSFDALGQVRWAFPIGGPDLDAATAVAVLASQHIVVGGTFRGTADFLPGPTASSLTAFGGGDTFLASYTAAAALRWARALGGAAEDSLARGGLAPGADGSVTATGLFSGTIDLDGGAGTANRTSFSGTVDWFAARYAGDGSFVSGFAIGGDGEDFAPVLTVDGDGSMVVAGAFRGAVDFDPGTGVQTVTALNASGGTDIFVARYASAGGFLSVSRFGDAAGTAEGLNAPLAVRFDGAGKMLVAGRFSGGPDVDPGTAVYRLTSLGLSDGFLVKLDASGALELTP